MATTEIPEILLDAESLAKNIYDYWVSTLRTDLPGEAGGWPSWDDTEDVYKQNFVESVRVGVVDLLKRLKEEMEFESRLDASFSDSEVVPTEVAPTPARYSACYSCERQPVHNPGDMCLACLYTHTGVRVGRKR